MTYYYIDSEFRGTYEVKRSKFYSYLLPLSIYEKRLAEIKIMHIHAHHYIVAYRKLDDFANLIEFCDDDGEPVGLCAKPTLDILAIKNLIDCAVITVRYFGGTMLGRRGLFDAYSSSTIEAIKGAKLKEYTIKRVYRVYVEMDRYKELKELTRSMQIIRINESLIYTVFLKLSDSEYKLLADSGYELEQVKNI